LAEVTDYPIQKNRQMLNLLFRLGLQHAYGPAAEKVRQAYIPFLQSCPLESVYRARVLLTHSIPEAVDRQGFDGLGLRAAHRPRRILGTRGGVSAGVGARLPQGERTLRLPSDARQPADQRHEPAPQGYAVPNECQIILDCCTEKAAYLVLPLAHEDDWTQEEVLKRIQYLP